MACTPERGERIGELAGGRLPAAVADELLAHVERCAACSQELDLVADLLCSPTLLGAARARVLRPWVLAAVGLAAAAVLLFLVLRARGPERRLRDLAQLSLPPIADLVLRGEEGAGEGDLDAALAELAAGRHAPAAERLEELCAARPQDARAHLYLGLARLQLGRHEAALAPLARAGELGTSLLGERALWYRAQALLALEQEEDARRALERLVELDGDYEPNARVLLDELRALGE